MSVSGTYLPPNRPNRPLGSGRTNFCCWGASARAAARTARLIRLRRAGRATAERVEGPLVLARARPEACPWVRSDWAIAMGKSCTLRRSAEMRVGKGAD
jgi:hypothetical protein